MVAHRGNCLEETMHNNNIPKVALAIFSALLACAEAAAQGYPSKPMRWLVGYPAGGGADFISRAIGAQLSANTSQPVVIDNRPGAATIIAAEATAKSAPDGYTMMLADNGTLVFNAALYSKLPYSPTADLAPVSLVVRVPLLLVANPSFPGNDAKAFIEQAKQQPGKLSYGSPGAGTPHHLAMEMFRRATGTNVTHVAYKGAAPAVQDLIGGQIPLMILDTAVALPQLRAGKIKALGALTPTRLAQLPDVPTMGEQGIADVVAYAWLGIVLPAATPREVVTALNVEIGKAVTNPAVSAKLRDFGMEPLSSTPEQMRDYIQAETRRWHPLIKERGIRMD
jgi:tripartite-type tricarboxylate transporter receptor subunit TctC